MHGRIFYLFMAGFCAVVLAGVYGSSLLVAGAGLLILFLVVAVLVTMTDITAFYLLCSGVPAVFIVASVSLMYGCFATILLLGTMAASTGETDTRMGKITFGSFSILFLLLCVPLLQASHVLPWLSALGVLGGIAVFLLLIGEYRIKNQYRGEKT
jgi:hypothetical protein